MASLPPTAPQAADNYQPSHSAAVNYGSSPPSAKVSLTTWWEKFKKKPAASKEGGDKDHPPGIFGVPLSKSIKYANVAISLTDTNGDQFIYGYVPIVVAKCGVFLKEKATNVEGIFRLSGSAKRIKDLQTIFNSPDKYGKGLDWAGYTVHDAANIFRRYLNQLPEPIIPLDFYARFREPLQCAPEHFDAHAAIRAYQELIGKLPALNRQLLLYILDLLAVFASKSEQNLMNASNLAAIFQPGLINHPEHDMSPSDYKLSQDVLVFLITNQDHFLLGMRGNAESEGDNLNVPLVPASPASPRRAKTVISRSPSNSSAGADDVRKYGNLRRNVSVTSRRSTAGSPIIGSGGGLNRSNTLPSKRSPAVSPVTFRGDHTPTPSSPRGGLAPEKNIIARSPSVGGRVRENVTPVSTTSDDSVKTLRPMVAPPRARPLHGIDTETPPAQSRPVTTPVKERNFANFFAGLSPEPHDRYQRPGNKLRKQRRPGSTTHSADSSTTNLGDGNTSNPSTQNGHGPPPTSHSSIGGDTLAPVPRSPPMAPTASMLHYFGISQQGNAPHSTASSATLMPAMSPTPSTTSSVTSQSSSHEYSDTTNPSSSPEKKKRSRWRLSGQKLDNQPTSPTFVNGHHSTGSLAERIRGASRSPPHRTRSVSGEASGMSDGEEKRSAFAWLSKKVNERKHNHQQCEKEREQREHERSRGGREEMHVSVDNLPKLPMSPPMPGSPRVQPPTPSTITLPTTPIQEHPVDPARERGNTFRRDRQMQQRNVPIHAPTPMHNPVPMRSPIQTPRTSEERERMYRREGHAQNRDSQSSLHREGQMQQQREIQVHHHKEGQIPQREILTRQRENQMHPGEVPMNQRDGQIHQRETPVNQRDNQIHQQEASPVNQREAPVHQREISAHQREGSIHQREGSIHQREGPELPLYAPVPGESIEPEGQMQQRRRPQGIRPGEPLSIQGIMPQGLPGGRMSQGMNNPMSPGPMSPPGTAM